MDRKTDIELVARLHALFKQALGTEPEQTEELPGSGSYRRYFRLKKGSRSAIGAVNDDIKENRAFLYFAKHFHKAGLPVPEIIAEDSNQKIYLQQDLGDKTLFDLFAEEKKNSSFSPVAFDMSRKVLEWLPRFQAGALEGLDFSICYPRSAFDRQSMMWDLSYFKYYFLKLARIPFDEQDLENDFNTLCDFLLDCRRDFFLYRDFQSRNIMIHDGEPWFIDFQGGRQGALQYDPASLLFDAKADIPKPARDQLIQIYVNSIESEIGVKPSEFFKHYHGYVLIRILQAMGAFGFRGFYEKKIHFLDSIPYAIRNLDQLLDNFEIPAKIPTLMGVLRDMVNSEHLHAISAKRTTLHITINSFSYRRGIPIDESGNGGGFVMDCRALPNPGRFQEFKEMNGNDLPVRTFLDDQDEVQTFLHRSMDLIRPSIENYKNRNFNHLMLSFGCTGGQHRSVYCAEELAAMLRKMSGVEVVVRHRELELKK